MATRDCMSMCGGSRGKCPFLTATLEAKRQKAPQDDWLKKFRLSAKGAEDVTLTPGKLWELTPAKEQERKEAVARKQKNNTRNPLEDWDSKFRP